MLLSQIDISFALKIDWDTAALRRCARQSRQRAVILCASLTSCYGDSLSVANSMRALMCLRLSKTYLSLRCSVWSELLKLTNQTK
jgi:hypothetical protein